MKLSLLHTAVIALYVFPILTNAGLVKNQSVLSDGKTRTYDVYVPGNVTDKPIPVVLLLHGHMGSADVMTGENNKSAPYKVWLTIAERETWLLVIPDGEFGSDNKRGWNDCRANAKTNPQTDDVKFLNELLNNISIKYKIDTRRIFAHGTSNGGNMVYRLAQESGDRFRAMAAIVAAMPEENKCKSARSPISMLIMNGTHDPILPFSGGRVGKRESHKNERGSALSTQASIDYWLAIDGITNKPVETKLPNRNTKDSSSVHVKHYYGGKNNTEVVLYTVEGGGHTEPSLTEHYGRLYSFIVGKQNKDIEMVEEVWKFFAKHN